MYMYIQVLIKITSENSHQVSLEPNIGFNQRKFWLVPAQFVGLQKYSALLVVTIDDSQLFPLSLFDHQAGTKDVMHKSDDPNT